MSLEEAIDAAGATIDRPVFNLADEPWIPTCDQDGTNRRCRSLREVLDDAHKIDIDSSVYGALHLHAMHRYLIAIGYMLHAYAPGHDWQSVCDGDGELPGDAIDKVVERLSGHLWLHHPDTPFMQRADVLSHVELSAGDSKPPKRALAKFLKDDLYWVLVPYAPSKSMPAFFGRTESDVSRADVANRLVESHYTALSGNVKANDLYGSPSTKGSTAMWAANHGRTLVTRDGKTVSQTIVANLLDDWLKTIDCDSVTFWEAPKPRRLAEDDYDELWLYTASMVSLYVIPDSSARGGYRVLRTPLPVPHLVGDKKMDKVFMKDVMPRVLCDNDPHTLRRDDDENDKGFVATQLPAGGGAEAIGRFYKKIGKNRLRTPSVVQGRATRYRGDHPVMVLTTEGAGNAANPGVSATDISFTKADNLDLNPLAAAVFANLAESAVGRSGATNRIIFGEITDLLPGSHQLNSKVYGRLKDETARHLSRHVDTTLERLLHECADWDHESELPPKVGFTPQEVNNISQAAASIFSEAAMRINAGIEHRAKVANSRTEVERRVRLALSNDSDNENG